jgi:hypothetical protein
MHLAVVLQRLLQHRQVPATCGNVQVFESHWQSCSRAYLNTAMCLPQATECSRRLVPLTVVLPCPLQHPLVSRRSPRFALGASWRSVRATHRASRGREPLSRFAHSVMSSSVVSSSIRSSMYYSPMLQVTSMTKCAKPLRHSV